MLAGLGPMSGYDGASPVPLLHANHPSASATHARMARGYSSRNSSRRSSTSSANNSSDGNSNSPLRSPPSPLPLPQPLELPLTLPLPPVTQGQTLLPLMSLTHLTRSQSLMQAQAHSQPQSHAQSPQTPRSPRSPMANTVVPDASSNNSGGNWRNQSGRSRESQQYDCNNCSSNRGSNHAARSNGTGNGFRSTAAAAAAAAAAASATANHNATGIAMYVPPRPSHVHGHGHGRGSGSNLADALAHAGDDGSGGIRARRRVFPISTADSTSSHSNSNIKDDASASFDAMAATHGHQAVSFVPFCGFGTAVRVGSALIASEFSPSGSKESENNSTSTGSGNNSNESDSNIHLNGNSRSNSDDFDSNIVPLNGIVTAGNTMNILSSGGSSGSSRKRRSRSRHNRGENAAAGANTISGNGNNIRGNANKIVNSSKAGRGGNTPSHNHSKSKDSPRSAFKRTRNIVNKSGADSSHVLPSSVHSQANGGGMHWNMNGSSHTQSSCSSTGASSSFASHYGFTLLHSTSTAIGVNGNDSIRNAAHIASSQSMPRQPNHQLSNGANGNSGNANNSMPLSSSLPSHYGHGHGARPDSRSSTGAGAGAVKVGAPVPSSPSSASAAAVAAAFATGRTGGPAGAAAAAAAKSAAAAAAAAAVKSTSPRRLVRAMTPGGGGAYSPVHAQYAEGRGVLGPRALRFAHSNSGLNSSGHGTSGHTDGDGSGNAGSTGQSFGQGYTDTGASFFCSSSNSLGGNATGDEQQFFYEDDDSDDDDDKDGDAFGDTLALAAAAAAAADALADNVAGVAYSQPGTNNFDTGLAAGLHDNLNSCKNKAGSAVASPVAAQITQGRGRKRNNSPCKQQQQQQQLQNKQRLAGNNDDDDDDNDKDDVVVTTPKLGVKRSRKADSISIYSNGALSGNAHGSRKAAELVPGTAPQLSSQSFSFARSRQRPMPVPDLDIADSEMQSHLLPPPQHQALLPPIGSLPFSASAPASAAAAAAAAARAPVAAAPTGATPVAVTGSPARNTAFRATAAAGVSPMLPLGNLRLLQQQRKQKQEMEQRQHELQRQQQQLQQQHQRLGQVFPVSYEQHRAPGIGAGAQTDRDRLPSIAETANAAVTVAAAAAAAAAATNSNSRAPAFAYGHSSPHSRFDATTSTTTHSQSSASGQSAAPSFPGTVAHGHLSHASAYGHVPNADNRHSAALSAPTHKLGESNAAAHPANATANSRFEIINRNSDANPGLSWNEGDNVQGNSFSSVNTNSDVPSTPKRAGRPPKSLSHKGMFDSDSALVGGAGASFLANMRSLITRRFSGVNTPDNNCKNNDSNANQCKISSNADGGSNGDNRGQRIDVANLNPDYESNGGSNYSRNDRAATGRVDAGLNATLAARSNDSPARVAIVNDAASAANGHAGRLPAPVPAPGVAVVDYVGGSNTGLNTGGGAGADNVSFDVGSLVPKQRRKRGTVKPLNAVSVALAVSAAEAAAEAVAATGAAAAAESATAAAAAAAAANRTVAKIAPTDSAEYGSVSGRSSIQGLPPPTPVSVSNRASANDASLSTRANVSASVGLLSQVGTSISAAISQGAFYNPSPSRHSANAYANSHNAGIDSNDSARAASATALRDCVDALSSHALLDLGDGTAALARSLSSRNGTSRADSDGSGGSVFYLQAEDGDDANGDLSETHSASHREQLERQNHCVSRDQQHYLLRGS